MRLSGFERSGIVLVAAWMLFFGFLFWDKEEQQVAAFAQSLAQEGVALGSAKMVVLGLLSLASLIFLTLYLIALRRFEEIMQLYTEYETLSHSDPANDRLEQIKLECESLKRGGIGWLAGLIGKLPVCKERR